MDVKEYISSGIIESYAIGVLGDQERREVECLSKIYPEIAEELFAVQATIERLSDDWKKTPPPALKQAVMNAIRKEANAGPETGAKVIAMPVSSSPINNIWKYAAAASFIGIAVLGGLYITTRNEVSEKEKALTAKNEKVESLNSEVTTLQASLENFNAQNEVLLDESTKMIALTGTALSPDSDMKVFWNADRKKVGMFNTDLPVPAADLQYQLWAIVDGKPVDLGVFDVLHEKEIVTKDLDLKNIQAFAVTLEKKGGSPTPNLEQLYVIGNV